MKTSAFVKARHFFAGLSALTLLLFHGSCLGDTFAFFYALDADWVQLQKCATSSLQTTKVGGRTILIAQVGKQRVVAVKMGSGPVETALSAQALLSKFNCDAAVTVGPVGSLTDSLPTGTWCRVESVVPYQKGKWGRSGFEASQRIEFFASSNQWSAIAPPVPFEEATNVVVASGEMFIASSRKRDELRQSTSAQVVDMNLFGLAKACLDHSVPLFCWRVVSDMADDNASDDFRRFVQNYDGAAGKAAGAWIKDLPPNPNSPSAYPKIKRLLE
jgi:nucleoside phosphorylase